MGGPLTAKKSKKASKSTFFALETESRRSQDGVRTESGRSQDLFLDISPGRIYEPMYKPRVSMDSP